jgi:hypothetical protein
MIKTTAKPQTAAEALEGVTTEKGKNRTLRMNWLSQCKAYKGLRRHEVDPTPDNDDDYTRQKIE